MAAAVTSAAPRPTTTPTGISVVAPAPLFAFKQGETKKARKNRVRASLKATKTSAAAALEAFGVERAKDAPEFPEFRNYVASEKDSDKPRFAPRRRLFVWRESAFPSSARRLLLPIGS